LDILAPSKTKPLDSLFNEVGGHRVQRIPEGEKRGRVHSSTVTVSVIDQEGMEDIPAYDAEQFHIVFFSGTGPGGQNRNKVQASARITHLPTGIVRSAQTRSRKNSVALAMAALEEDLRQLNQAQAHRKQNDSRRAQVGSGMRGDKRRTYRFQEARVYDHPLGTAANLEKVLSGGFEELWPGK